VSENYIVVGNGIAGAAAAEELREKSEDINVKVFTDESEPLYNRIMLKSYMKGQLPKQYARVHDKNWYEKRGIKLFLDTRVEKVDTGNREILTENGKTHSYDKILVATGGRPRKLPQDKEYENVNYMWTIEDSEVLKKSAEESEKAVVIGGGLLGIDFAVAYAEHDTETYYLIRGENWWRRGLDPEGASIIHEKLEEKGVKVVTNAEVESLKAENNKVKTVQTAEGKSFDCDSVAVAIGHLPNSELLDVEKNSYGAIKTNEYLQTSEPGVYAAGDMVEYQHPIFGEKTMNGAWDHSEKMGITAARNMLGEEQKFDYINTYGVGHFDTQFLAIGDWTGEPISRLYEDNHYRRLFFENNKLVGAVMIGFTKGQEKIKEMIESCDEVDDRETLLKKEYWN